MNLLVLRGVVAVAAACLRLLERDDVSATRHGSTALCVATGKNTAIAGKWANELPQHDRVHAGERAPFLHLFSLSQNTWMLLFYQRCDPRWHLGTDGGYTRARSRSADNEALPTDKHSTEY